MSKTCSYISVVCGDTSTPLTNNLKRGPVVSQVEIDANSNIGYDYPSSNSYDKHHIDQAAVTWNEPAINYTPHELKERLDEDLKKTGQSDADNNCVVVDSFNDLITCGSSIVRNLYIKTW